MKPNVEIGIRKTGKASGLGSLDDSLRQLREASIGINRSIDGAFRAFRTASAERDIVASIPKLAADITPAFAGFRDAQSSMYERLRVPPVSKPVLAGIDEALKQAVRVNDHVAAGISRLSSSRALAGFAALVAPLASLADDIGEMEDSKFPFKWAGSLPLPLARRLFELWDQGDVLAMHQLLTEGLLDEPIGQTILDECRECALVGPATDIIADAFWAHMQGKYSLSIPALMAQTEGVIRRIAVEVGAMATVQGTGRHWTISTVLGATRGTIEAKIAAAGGSQPTGFVGPLFGPFLAFMEKQYFRSRRNPVTHGNNVEYARLDLSCECVLALYEAVDAARTVMQWGPTGRP